MDTAIRKAYEVFGFANQQELEAWDLERRREKASFDMGSRLSGAQRKGEEKKAIEIARKLKDKGLPLAEVVDVTGLPPEFITNL